MSGVWSNGTCVCTSDYSGALCDTRRYTWGQVAIVGGAVVVTMSVCMCCCCVWRLRRQRRARDPFGDARLMAPPTEGASLTAAEALFMKKDESVRWRARAKRGGVPRPCVTLLLLLRRRGVFAQDEFGESITATYSFSQKGASGGSASKQRTVSRDRGSARSQQPRG